MKKLFSKISAFILTLVLVFAVSGFLFPQTIHAQGTRTPSANTPGTCFVGGIDKGKMTYSACGTLGGLFNPDTVAPRTAPTSPATPKTAKCSPYNFLQCFTDSILLVPGWAAIGILKLVSLLTYLSGALLNFILKFTVVDMSVHINEAGAINNAWVAIRDVANMGFIFVLLYAAIQTILGIGSDNKKIIVNIIVVAILINFSLFFTKVVIDASNVLAVYFYDAIAPGSLAVNATTGLSNSLMQPLDLQSIFKTDVSGLEGGKLFTIGVMGTVLALIVTFIFFAISIMFIIRFVVLIFILILSPVAFVSFVLPGLSGQWKKWLDALIGQAFFAPAYFLLTWIVIVVSRGLLTGGGDMAVALSGTLGPNGQAVAPDSTSLGILVNFIIMIALLIASLLIAKDMANKAGPGVAGLTKWATGAVGGVAFGGLGKLGRGTFGNLGIAAAENASLQEAAKNKTGLAGAASRLALYTAKKARSGTYDPRNATIPTSVFGAAIEGTFGRSDTGKKLGLNDVNIPSVPVGAFAAGVSGVGAGGTQGAKEAREESRKRVRDSEAQTIKELSQAQNKLSIEAGTAAAETASRAGRPPTPAEKVLIDKMVRTIQKMSDKELELQKATTLAIREVAENLSPKQLEKIQSSENFTDTERDTIFAKHFESINDALDAVAAGTATSVQTNSLKNLSDKELEILPTNTFNAANPRGAREQALLKTVSQTQVDALIKSKTVSEKQAIKDERARPLNDAYAAGRWTSTATGPGAVDIMRGMRPEDLVKLEDSKLIDPNILELYTPALLNKMAARTELTEAKALAIRNAINTNGPAAPAGSNLAGAHAWINGPGLNIF